MLTWPQEYVGEFLCVRGWLQFLNSFIHFYNLRLSTECELLYLNQDEFHSVTYDTMTWKMQANVFIFPTTAYSSVQAIIVFVQKKCHVKQIVESFFPNNYIISIHINELYVPSTSFFFQKLLELFHLLVVFPLKIVQGVIFLHFKLCIDDTHFIFQLFCLEGK